MERAEYSTDLTDKQWKIIEPLLSLPSSRAGRPPEYNLREIINAILYLGIQVVNGESYHMIFPNGRVFIIISVNIKKREMVIDSYVNT